MILKRSNLYKIYFIILIAQVIVSGGCSLFYKPPELFLGENGEELTLESFARGIRGEVLYPLSSTAKINSPFGKRWANFHEGIDLKADLGAPILSSISGKVVFSGVYGSYGKMLVIRRGNLLTVYAHCSKLLVIKGAFVRRGEKIAEVGKTGRASGYHLHFEIRLLNKSGRFVAVDPELFLPS
ncbi:MAG TPA: M23 family metallopeptidase [Oligoflexia bacterium]|nr:M23 family metallopeptidase [Oligoflexia bacterium]HMP26539.1 M23 family metallopeptidase [Oligoflexia bacterium]